ncbi:MAG: cryptochrome/photolyase family protein [Prochlorotrichaceae cyanobacterium]
MRILFWHRRDLRVGDNQGLWRARQCSAEITGVFCLDPGILQREDLAPIRVSYLLANLHELQQQYHRLGSELLILHQSPLVAIPALAQAIEAKAVYWNSDVEPYAQERDHAVSEALQARGIAVETTWDQLLHEPGSILTGAERPYTVYTPFWKNCRQQAVKAPYPTPEAMQGLSPEVLKDQGAIGVIPLPTPEALGFPRREEWVSPPGELAVLEQLGSFCQEALTRYGDDRNFPGQPGTSRLSPALKFGTIGIRTVWQAAQEQFDFAQSDETRKQIETWQKELIWREFYQHCLYHFPQLAEGPYRPQWNYFPWENDPLYFQAWCTGRTGYPIVDAAMQELLQTGWMHNRCRMIVASFLTKDLIVDWRWGERYFMQHLLDGDLASNNGGWQWSASSGMDSQPLRIFNPNTQAQRFDPEGEYIRRWLPELASVETEYLLTANIPPLLRGDYPEPIVDHHRQQQRFKAFYHSLPSISSSVSGK